MQVDFSIELGADDEALELPWAFPDGGLRYYDLRSQPELLLNVEEAHRVPELGEFLAAINSPASLLQSAKCDVWPAREISPEEEIFGAACKYGCYVDLIFVSEAPRFSLPDHEQLAQSLTHLLRRIPEIPAAAEFLIRRCYYHSRERDGFYFTFYLFGYADDETQARSYWSIALKLVENAMRQLSAAARPSPNE